MSLTFTDALLEKILQFHEATQQRMGVVVVGPSGTGKSVIWRVRQDVQSLSSCVCVSLGAEGGVDQNESQNQCANF